jgi:hypothetical protein
MADGFLHVRPAGDQSLAVKDRSGVPAETVDEKQRCGQAERKPDSRGNDAGCHQGHDDKRGKAGQHAELLGNADVCGTGGDGNADPDRPACEERRAQQLDEQVGGLRKPRRR